MAPSSPRTFALAPGVTLLVRGWLHGNSVLLRGPGAAPPVLIDSGYHTGATELLAWLDATLGGREALAEILLTHVHSDHGGGVAAVVAATGAKVRSSRSARDLVARWDEGSLWLGPSGQVMPRFHVDEAFADDGILRFGVRHLRVVATPGHMGCAVAFFDEADGLLITGDALWESGFGLLDPWIEGWDCFDLAARALARLKALDGVAMVVPGHGPPFTDFTGALARAEARLAELRASPNGIRRLLAQNGIAFLALANPDLELDRLAEGMQRMLEGHPPVGPGPDEPGPEALIRDAVTALRARRPRPPSG